ncbi:MAG: proline dehydrogenase family protein [Vicinamibacterales bacterium]
MSVIRDLLLAGSENAWLREQAMRSGFVRRSVSRFMPGERLDDALAAARTLQAAGLPAILTRLGENVRDAGEADAVAAHYLEALDRIHATPLDAQISVKPTQLGLDLSVETCRRYLVRLAARAQKTGNRVWIDMESTAYVDRTIDLYRDIRSEWTNVGVCLQAYLYRTPELLDALIPLGPAIRIVKGAYSEPPSLALRDKAQVDEQFYQLSARLVAADAQAAGAFLGIGTHDATLIARLQTHMAAQQVPRERYEFEMLFGIRRDLQAQLARAGARVRVLISYGEYWFPWYMRRLAERPANLWFVAKNLAG